MKVLAIARKALREYIREPLLLGLLFAFPLALLGFYAVAFSGTDVGLAHYLKVLVRNVDEGPAGAVLIEALADLAFEGLPVFDLTAVTDAEAAQIALREHKAALLITIPPDFSAALDRGAAAVDVAGDPFTETYSLARSYIDGTVRAVGAALTDQPAAPPPAYEFVAGTGTLSDFDFGVGGIIVFGVMFLVITTAHVLVREAGEGTLRRLRLTRAAAADLLLGVMLAQLVLALVLVPVMLGAALLLGFQSHGSLLAALIVALLLAFSAIGLGLIVACFVRSDGEAANLGAGILVPMVLLSGALFPMPDAPLFSLGGRTVQVYDLLPVTHAAAALRRILVLGEGLGAVLYELGGLVVLGGLGLAVGIVLYQRLQLRRG